MVLSNFCAHFLLRFSILLCLFIVFALENKTASCIANPVEFPATILSMIVVSESFDESKPNAMPDIVNSKNFPQNMEIDTIHSTHSEMELDV